MLADLDDGDSIGGEDTLGGDKTPPLVPDDDDTLEDRLAPLPGDDDAPEDRLAVPAAASLLAEVRAAAELPETEQSRRWIRAAHHYLAQKVHIGSVTAEAVKLGLQRRDVRLLRQLCAGLAIDLEKEFWLSVESGLVRAASRPEPVLEMLVHLEIFTYDGVDMTMATRHRPTLGDDFRVPVDSGDDPDEAKRELNEYLQEIGDDVELGPAKLVNSLHHVAILCRRGEKMVVLSSEATTWLQVVNKNSGETLKRAMEDVRLGGESARDQCSRRVRLTTTDAASYNLRAERNHDRHEDTPVLHLTCDVHSLATVHTRVFALCDETVTGIQRISNSLQGGSTMSLFRKAMRRVLARDLKLVYTSPPEATSYRNAILDLFCGDEIGLAPLRSILLQCAGGDWRDDTGFQFLVKSDGLRRRVDILKMLYKHLVPALAGHVPASFPRHRWTGALKSVRDVGLMACCHNLLRRTYDEFMLLVESGVVRAGGVRMPAAVAEMLDGDDGQAVDPESLPANSAEAKKKFRGAASEFVRLPDTPSEFVAMAIVLRPISVHMEKLIETSSAVWMSMQDVARMRAMKEEGFKIEDCDWPLILASEQVFELECLQSIADAHDQARYTWWPPVWRTNKAQTKLFCLLSRAAAAIKEMQLKKHQTYPYRLFRLLRHPNEVDDVLAGCVEMRDDYTRGFVAAHGEDLRSASALAELSLIAMHARTSTVTLESLNASVRRRIVVAQTQVTMCTVEAVSAEFALGKLRRRERGFECPPGHKQSWKNEVVVRRDEKQAKKRGGGGGAYRTWLHETADGTPMASTEKALKYRALTPAAKAGLAERGALATTSHSYGVPAFGVQSKVLLLDVCVFVSPALHSHRRHFQEIDRSYQLMSQHVCRDVRIKLKAEECICLSSHTNLLRPASRYGR